MNKKLLLVFCAVALLLAALLAALLIGSGDGKNSGTQPDTTTTATGEIGGTEEKDSAAEKNGETPTGETANDPTFRVEFGAGDKADFGFDDDTTQSSQASQPSQGQTSGGTLDATNGENGMPDKLLTYEAFLALSNEEQQAYFFLFADPLDYAQWLHQAQQDYEDGKTSIIVTGPVDLETLP